MSGETRRPWSPQEDEAIKMIVRELGTKRWSDISLAMQEKFKLFGRSGKQCRQRWHNHLAPDVNKKPWSMQEQETLFEAHKKHGNKWTQISKLIEGRTDNAIKNHFYSSIRRSLRRINKILGSKNSTVKMRNIKPAVLSAIFNMADRQQENDSKHYKDLTLALIQFSRNRVKKQKGINQEQKLGLQNLINKLTQFNKIYEKNRTIRTNTTNDSRVSSQYNQSRKQSNQEDQQQIDQQEQDEIQKQQINNPQPSIVAHSNSQHELGLITNSGGKKINLQQSEYDWQEFQQRCQTIVNRYLVSQCSLKSMQHILPEQINNSSQATQILYKPQVTPNKSQKDSQCSVKDVSDWKTPRSL